MNVKDIGEYRAQISKNMVYRGYLNINNVNINRAPFENVERTLISNQNSIIPLSKKYIKSVLKKISKGRK